MELKKTPEADLEKGRVTFFLMGFAVALSGFFVLLEWQSPETEPEDWRSLAPVFIENEFEAANQPEKTVPAAIPQKSEPETVYEDYEITKEAPAVEKPDETEDSSSYSESDEMHLNQVESLPAAPDETKAHGEAATSAETMPQFPGGQAGLVRFLYENIQYPSVALKQRIEGRVWCSFIVETDGSISNVSLEKGVYVFLDEEAIRVLKKMPAWEPGQTKGENIRVKIYIPIVFKR